jgi:hypothetical protein
MGHDTPLFTEAVFFGEAAASRQATDSPKKIFKETFHPAMHCSITLC